MLKGILGRVGDILRGSAPVDEDLLDELEEALIQADVSMATTERLLKDLKRESRREGIKEAGGLRQYLEDRITGILAQAEAPVNTGPAAPLVFLVVGVNGVGKTTSIAKIGYWYRSAGHKVLFAAADTFRAAAIEQLEEWAKRADCDIVKGQAGADPGAVVHDAVEAAKARGVGLVIVDTAGRLHTKTNLMEELRKLRRVVERTNGRPPDETLLVLDATMGQNALQQARLFRDVVDVTGLFLAKMDGTAKGGAVLSIVEELGLPIKLVGVGEKLWDLRLFSAREMAEEMLA
jgi:fused signal recognition particle receptor